MIGPPQPPTMDGENNTNAPTNAPPPPWDAAAVMGGATTTGNTDPPLFFNPPNPAAPANPAGPGAAWRERERRQRTVRLLMMFLLMLLLMDSEEQQMQQQQQQNSHLRHRSGYNSHYHHHHNHHMRRIALLDSALYRARRLQDERIYKISRVSRRFRDLVLLNTGHNMETQIRTWVMQHEEQEEEEGAEGRASNVQNDNSVEKSEEKVWHYPWNSTGFYRGEWVKLPPSRQEQFVAEETVATTSTSANKSPTTSWVGPVEMEGPLKQRLLAQNDTMAVLLLPPHSRLKVDKNYTLSPVEHAAAEAMATAAARFGNAASSSAATSSTSWTILGPSTTTPHQASSDFVVLEDESDHATVGTTLTKSFGRAAFQFYSRSVAGMEELSLVDGFVKLYDSHTVGYSTRRDILLRVRGVLIHSIGKLSLVANAAPGRSALVLGGDGTGGTGTTAWKRNKVSPEQEQEQQDNKKSPSPQRRRRLQELVLQSKQNIEEMTIQDIRDEALDLFPHDVVSDKGRGWTLFSSFGGQKGTTEFESIFPFERSGWLFDLLESFGLPEDPSTASAENTESHQEARRRLSTTTNEALETNVTEENNVELPNQEDRVTRRIAQKKKKKRNLKQQQTSRIVIPYPFVPDDKIESIRKFKTPAARRMPMREQLLEANAGRCEFQVNMDVSPVEWTVGEWRRLVRNQRTMIKQVDPSQEKEEENDDEVEGEHSRKHSTDRTLYGKPVQDQALVMVMAGSIVSPNCDFSASLNATAIRTDWDQTTAKAINYSFYMMLTCLTQIVVLLRQLLHTQHQTGATKVSLMCIGWQTVLDALLCLGHIYLSLAMQPLFTAFASVAFFKLLIFCVIEMKYMAIIIQARNNANGNQSTNELLRRQVAMLHLRFYVALVVAFLAFFYAGQKYRTIYILGLYSFWLPQIIYNIVTEARKSLHSYYIYGMSITRMVAPVYIFAFPNNFLKEVYPDSPTNGFMVQLLFLWIAIQTAILVAQNKYGARFMIPARFLPPKFDYHRPIPASLIPPEALEPQPDSETRKATSSNKSSSSLESGGVINRHKKDQHKNNNKTITINEPPDKSPTLDCVICCSEVEIRNRKGYMLAPCNHIFHKECLIPWMDVKMECPICRTELPPL